MNKKNAASEKMGIDSGEEGSVEAESITII